MFLFRNSRQGVDVVSIGHIQFRSGCFQKECQLNMQLQKHHNLWFQLVCDMVIVGTVETRCLERKAVLFVAVSIVGSVFKLSKILTSPLNDDNNIQW